jgi:hypothetical protein
VAVLSDSSSVTHTGNGVWTEASVPFPFSTAASLVVTLAGVAQTLGVHYAVTGGNGATGAVQMFVAPPVGEELLIERQVDLTQPTAFRDQGSFSPAVHERALDHVVYGLQQVARSVDEVADAATERADAAEAAVAGLETRLDELVLDVGAAQVVAGGIGTGQLADGAVTRAKLAGDGAPVTSATFHTSTASIDPVDVPASGVTLTTHGRPVLIALQVAPASTGMLRINAVGQAGDSASITFIAEGVGILTTHVATFQVGGSALGVTDLPLSGFMALWTPAAGTYTIRAMLGLVRNGEAEGSWVGFSNARLLAYEL